MSFNFNRDEFVLNMNLVVDEFVNCMLCENVVDRDTADEMRRYLAHIEMEKSMPKTIRERIAALFGSQPDSGKYRIIISRISPWFTQPQNETSDARTRRDNNDATMADSARPISTRRIRPNSERTDNNA